MENNQNEKEKKENFPDYNSYRILAFKYWSKRLKGKLLERLLRRRPPVFPLLLEGRIPMKLVGKLVDILQYLQHRLK